MPQVVETLPSKIKTLSSNKEEKLLTDDHTI
jgi:hypothetical protein